MCSIAHIYVHMSNIVIKTNILSPVKLTAPVPIITTTTLPPYAYTTQTHTSLDHKPTSPSPYRHTAQYPIPNRHTIPPYTL